MAEGGRKTQKYFLMEYLTQNPNTLTEKLQFILGLIRKYLMPVASHTGVGISLKKFLLFSNGSCSYFYLCHSVRVVLHLQTQMNQGAEILVLIKNGCESASDTVRKQVLQTHLPAAWAYSWLKDLLRSWANRWNPKKVHLSYAVLKQNMLLCKSHPCSTLALLQSFAGTSLE